MNRAFTSRQSLVFVLAAAACASAAAAARIVIPGRSADEGPGIAGLILVLACVASALLVLHELARWHALRWVAVAILAVGWIFTLAYGWTVGGYFAPAMLLGTAAAVLAWRH
jgi:hypothetical protein